MTSNESDPTIKSLQIISRSPGIKPSAFARQYFPKDHEGWERHGRAGRGSTRGQGLILWAGGWLGKLKQRELISQRVRLTPKGQELLDQARNAPL